MPGDEAAIDETDGEEKDFLNIDPKDKGRKCVRHPYPWEETL